MHTTSISRVAKYLVGAGVAVLGLAFTASAAPFPPINATATSTLLPGKLVWADLFTSQPDEATKFYCGLLGWTSTAIDQKGKTYTVFMNAGVPVAGLAPHSYAKESHPSRWIGYISVADINAAVAAVEKAGGKVHASPKKFPDRGFQAIVADSDGNPIGLLQSSSGDPVDSETAPGAWNWFELYVSNPKATTDFYHNALNFDVAPEMNSDRKSDFVLSSNGNSRAGVAPIPDDAKEGKPRWLGVIRVADLDQTLSKVAGLGGQVLVAPHAVEYGSRFSIILDPTGGTLGLVQYIESANPAKTP